MKIIATICMMMIITTAFTQNEVYFIDMKTNVTALKKAESEKELLMLLERFSIIQQSEQDEWLPSYYIAMVNLKLAAIEANPEKLEGYYDEASNYVGNAIDQWPNESELMVLLAKVYMDQCKDKDFEESERYMEVARELLQNAIQMDETNPRAYLLMGKSIFDQNKKVAANTGESCEYFTLAADYFESFEPTSNIHPLWGTDQNIRLAASCKDKVDPADVEDRK